MFRFLSLFSLQLFLLLGDVLGNSSVKPRTKRGLSLELAKRNLLKIIIVDEPHALDKEKENVYVLQRDRCTNIKSVGKPITHNSRYYRSGAWMKDPLGIMGTETIFVMEDYEANNRLEEFENMDKFKEGVPRKTYKLPYQWDGTGGVVYGRYLYYNRENSNYIVKYNLNTERVEAQIPLSSSYYTPRKNYYQWRGYSGVDLAVDEQGLWVLSGHASNNGKRLYVHKIDVFRNTITHRWRLNTEPMNTMGNAFVACGIIYCIDSYGGKSTTINFAYDTKTGKQWNPNIQFTNQYGANYMVDYNPRERVLYAWDSHRQVTYPITFEEH